MAMLRFELANTFEKVAAGLEALRECLGNTPCRAVVPDFDINDEVAANIIHCCALSIDAVVVPRGSDELLRELGFVLESSDQDDDWRRSVFVNATPPQALATLVEALMDQYCRQDTAVAASDSAHRPDDNVWSAMVELPEGIPFDMVWPSVEQEIRSALASVANTWPRMGWSGGESEMVRSLRRAVESKGIGAIARGLKKREADRICARLGNTITCAVQVDLEGAAAAPKESSDPSTGTNHIAARVQVCLQNDTGSDQWTSAVVATVAPKGWYDVVTDEGIVLQRLPASRLRSAATRFGQNASTRPRSIAALLGRPREAAVEQATVHHSLRCSFSCIERGADESKVVRRYTPDELRSGPGPIDVAPETRAPIPGVAVKCRWTVPMSEANATGLPPARVPGRWTVFQCLCRLVDNKAGSGESPLPKVQVMQFSLDIDGRQHLKAMEPESWMPCPKRGKAEVIGPSFPMILSPMLTPSLFLPKGMGEGPAPDSREDVASQEIVESGERILRRSETVVRVCSDSTSDGLIEQLHDVGVTDRQVACAMVLLRRLREWLPREDDEAEVTDDVELVWESKSLSKKLASHLSHPLAVASGAMPRWCKVLPCLHPCLWSWSVREHVLRCTAFGLSYAVQRLQKMEVDRRYGEAQRQAEADVAAAKNAEDAAAARRQHIAYEAVFELQQKIVSDPEVYIGAPKTVLCKVDRENLLGLAESMMEVMASSRNSLECQFEGESGFGSAVTQGFYSEVSRELQSRAANAAVPLWAECESQEGEYLHSRRGLLIAPIESDDPRLPIVRKRFRMLGRMMGRALREGFVLPVPLTVDFFHALRGDNMRYDALPHPGDGLAGEFLGACARFETAMRRREAEDGAVDRRKWAEAPDWSQHYFYPMEVSSHPFSVYASAANFTAYGASGTPLCLGGEDREVSVDNVAEFVQLAFEFWTGSGIQAQVDEIREGLREVVGRNVNVLWAFEAHELRHLLCGGEKVNWTSEELAEHVHLAGGFSKDTEVVVWLRELLVEMDHDKRARFLDFVTSCPRLPPEGVKGLSIIIQPLPGGPSLLPTSRACARTLNLPVYPSKEALATKLMTAILSSTGHHES